MVEAVLARRPRAFEKLVREYQGLCWHIVQRMVRDPDDAREVCQNTFMRVYRHLHQYRFDSTLKTWIARVAYTAALRHLERKRIPLVEVADEEAHRLLLESVSDDVDLAAVCDEERAATRLRAAIERLAPLPRVILTLYHLEEIPIPEIARITGVADGTIKSHLFRSRLRLRQLLEAEESEHEPENR